MTLHSPACGLAPAPRRVGAWPSQQGAGLCREGSSLLVPLVLCPAVCAFSSVNLISLTGKCLRCFVPFVIWACARPYSSKAAHNVVHIRSHFGLRRTERHRPTSAHVIASTHGHPGAPLVAGGKNLVHQALREAERLIKPRCLDRISFPVMCEKSGRALPTWTRTQSPYRSSTKVASRRRLQRSLCAERSTLSSTAPR